MVRPALLLLGLVTVAACDPGSSSPAPRSDAATREASPGSSADSAAEAAPASASRVRTVFLGTSLTAGMGLEDPEDRFTDRIGALADSAGIPVEVVNAGVSGDTSAGGLRRLDWVLAGGADVLVVELGANDGLRGQDPQALERNLREVVERARELAPGVRIVLAGMEAPPNLGPDYTDRFRDVYPTLARELDLTLVPFLLDGVAGIPGMNQEDGIHPDAGGHRRIAETVLWPVLEPVLREAAREARAEVAGAPAAPGAS